MEYKVSDFKEFRVTGKTTNGKRFPTKIYPGNYSGWRMADGINLWNGRVWGILWSGKKVLLKTVTN